MIKKIAWDTFKNTGDINAFLELKQIENIEKNIGNNIEDNLNANNNFNNNINKEKDIEENGEPENKWNNTF